MSSGTARVKAAFKGEQGVELAAYPILGAVTAKLVGKSVKEYLTDPVILTAAHVKSFEELCQDVVAVDVDLQIEAEALGSELEFPDGQLCHVATYAVKEKRDIDKLKVPNPLLDGRLPYLFEGCREIKKAITDSPVGGVLVGPWSIAGSLRGLQHLIMDTFQDPQFVHSLMEITTETAKICGDAMIATGASLSYTDPASSCDVISPALYKKFIKPYHTSLFEYFKNKRTGITLHVCGNSLPILPDLVETGVMALSIDAKVPLPKAVEIVGNKVGIIGNVPTQLFTQRDPAKMDEAVRLCVEEARGKCRYILSSGCEVPIDAPMENIKWFMESARKYGK
jgi:uroporphyrinogen decarboxylase